MYVIHRFGMRVSADRSDTDGAEGQDSAWLHGRSHIKRDNSLQFWIHITGKRAWQLGGHMPGLHARVEARGHGGPSHNFVDQFGAQFGVGEGRILMEEQTQWALTPERPSLH